MAAYQDPYQTPPPSVYQSTSNLAIASLIAGILGWSLLPTIGAIVAVITGYMAKNEIRSSGGRLTGDGLATAGLVLGWINIALAVVGICLAALAIAGVITIPLCLVPFSNQIR